MKDGANDEILQAVEPVLSFAPSANDPFFAQIGQVPRFGNQTLAFVQTCADEALEHLAGDTHLASLFFVIGQAIALAD